MDKQIFWWSARESSEHQDSLSADEARWAELSPSRKQLDFLARYTDVKPANMLEASRLIDSIRAQERRWSS